jgi:hypothetical protein
MPPKADKKQDAAAVSLGPQKNEGEQVLPSRPYICVYFDAFHSHLYRVTSHFFDTRS